MFLIGEAVLTLQMIQVSSQSPELFMSQHLLQGDTIYLLV